MSYSSKEDNYDNAENLFRGELRPPEYYRLSVERDRDAERVSQVLVNEALEKEQTLLAVKLKVQDYPGIPEGGRVMDNVEVIMKTDPEYMYHGVKVPLTKGGTVTSRLKNLMGVANIRGRGAIPVGRLRARVKKSDPAQGLPVTEKGVSGSPVQSLNMLDQFFNFVNALLRVK